MILSLAPFSAWIEHISARNSYLFTSQIDWEGGCNNIRKYDDFFFGTNNMLLVWCMCVCCAWFFLLQSMVTDVENMLGFFSLARALTLNEVLLILLAMILTSGARSIVWCRVKKSMCKKTFSFSNRHFSCCFSSTFFIPFALFIFIFIFIIIICPRFLLALSLSLCQFFCCFVFFVPFQTLARALFVVWYFLLFVVIENMYCEFYDFWNAANNNRIRCIFFLCRSQCAARFCNGRFARVDGICFMSTFYHHLRFCAICYCYFSA